MKLARLGILLMALALGFNAQAMTPENASLTYDYTLDDVISPDEIASEIVEEQGYDVLAPRNERLFSSYSNRLHIVIDKAQKGTSPTAQTMQVYLDGQFIYNWWTSTGRETMEKAKSGKVYRSTTPVGDYRITWRNKDHHSKTWDAPMPYAQFFVGGIAIHAAANSAVRQLGTRASGGCVRLHIEHAEIIWDLVTQVGTKNVLITVVDGSQR